MATKARRALVCPAFFIPVDPTADEVSISKWTSPAGATSPPAVVPPAICSRCHQPAPGYDQLGERRFEFILLWGFLVFLLYAMRRVDCHRRDAVLVEEVPWGDGKHTLTKSTCCFWLAGHAGSWKETARIDLGITRLLWLGKERTIESFQRFFATIGEELASNIVLGGVLNAGIRRTDFHVNYLWFGGHSLKCLM